MISVPRSRRLRRRQSTSANSWATAGSRGAAAWEEREAKQCTTIRLEICSAHGRWATGSGQLRCGCCWRCCSVRCSAASARAKRHAAGLRTFVLVCLSGTAAMTLDRAIGSLPVISAAVVLGIAIISTNSILFSSKSQIRGLTTAAGLWSCSLLGLALGAGLYTLALLGFAAILACLSWLPAFETYLKDRSNHFEVHLELKSKYNLQDFVTTIRRLGLKIDDIEANPAYLNSGTQRLHRRHHHQQPGAQKIQNPQGNHRGAAVPGLYLLYRRALKLRKRPPPEVSGGGRFF